MANCFSRFFGTLRKLRPLRIRGRNESHPVYRKGIPLHFVSLLDWSYGHYFCEHVRFDRRFESALLHKVNPDAQEIHEIILEMDEIQKGSRAVKLHQDVHIARLRLLATDKGAEDPKVRNTIPGLEIRQV